VSFIHVEGKSPFSMYLRGLGFWCSGTFPVEGMRCLSLHPIRWGPTQRGSFEGWQPSLPLGSREVPVSHAVRSIPSPDPFQIGNRPLPLSSQEWWGHPWYGVPDSPVLSPSEELVISRLLGHSNQRLMVPGCKTPTHSERTSPFHLRSHGLKVY
jgi:hypothetical protein